MATGAYANQIEPRHLVLERRTIRLPRLTPALAGFRIALMSDHHLFPFTSPKLLEQAVEQANALHPDLILLGGDYVCADVESIRELAPIPGRLNAKYGVFAAPTDAPALQKADKAFIVPRVDQQDYIDTLSAICDDHQIGLLVPALEPELLLLTMNRARFFAIGTIPLVSSPEITATCCDKLATSNFLSKCGLLAPQTWIGSSASGEGRSST
jgi:hypothetical protein